ncbi:unnamed protein product [Rotaria sp. Silwood1]|nr:unnamed protein product [Rotaria sp. Silwood1]CAF3674842.1 unnamed protein product [Rotaria sp. Silwood1]CAF4806707.1 unnamed protein product [Rotaria sp. Silwood1]
MRHPVQYEYASKILWGRLLNHDDAVELNVLNKAFEETAEAWEKADKTAYGQILIDIIYMKSQCMSPCAVVVTPLLLSKGERCSEFIGGGIGD